MLQKNETEWTLNSKYPTKTKQIDELLRIASMLEAKNRSKTNSTKGLKVEYFAGDELIKSYFLMISESDSIGTSACIKNSSQAFVVHVPGEEPNFSKLFSPFIQDWRSLTIVQVKGSSKKIKISYFDKPQNSFSMELVQEIPKLYDFKDKNIFKINLEKAATYLRQLKNIEAKKITKLY